MALTGRLLRLLRLLELLQSGPLYSAADLAEETGVTRRTIFRDLQLLKKAGLQLRYDEERQGYALPPRTFLPPADLTVDETLSLLNLAMQLGGEPGIPFQDSAQAAAQKLLMNLPGPIRREVGELPATIVVRQDAHNPLRIAHDDFRFVLGAYRQRRKIQLRYDSLFEGREIETVVKPYGIFFERRSWYFIGYSTMHRGIRTFNVGRIVRGELLESPFRIPKWFKLESHFGKAWRFIRGETRYDVVIRFSSKVARNVAEVRWHETQRIDWNEDGTIDFRVRVDGLSEIQWWILGYGDEAEVLEPEDLRDELRKRIETMRQKYRLPTKPRRRQS